MKDVHKVPALDLVGWYTILSTSGPQPVHLPLHRQILHSYNESAILLGFHPTAVIERQAGGKLPLTIYESNYEAEEAATDPGEDKEMKDAEPQLRLKFKELPYSVETGEAEMISVDFVARGGGNATAVDGGNATAVDGTSKTTAQISTTADVNGKGKTRASKKSDLEEGDFATEATKQNILTREDEELIASLTAKANAIKMLQSRINLIAVYLQNLPPSYVSDIVPGSVEPDDKEYTPINYPILRSIQALLTRLSLLVPADSAGFEHELLAEQNDVNLVSLLSTITNSIKVVRETGKKSLVVETQKNMKHKSGDRSMWEPGNGVLGAGDLLR